MFIFLIERRPWANLSLNYEQKFEAACKAAPLYMGHFKPEDGLRLYGLYKQSTLGDISPTLEAELAKENICSDIGKSKF